MADNLKEQFSQIYDQYIDKIYRFVYLKVSSQEVAEDITSQVFMKTWEKFQHSKGTRNSKIQNCGAFLYQIARNAVVDYYRDKGRTKIISTDASPQIVDPKHSAQDKAILNADIDVIKKAIQKLKKEHQDVIIWHYLEDVDISDIAQMLGKPSGAVRVMLHRGLKELKNIIQES